MIRIGILGNIGSGKSYVASNFGYPVFDADYEVAKLYKKNKKVFFKLRKILPKNIKLLLVGPTLLYLIQVKLSESSQYTLMKQNNRLLKNTKK